MIVMKEGGENEEQEVQLMTDKEMSPSRREEMKIEHQAVHLVVETSHRISH